MTQNEWSNKIKDICKEAGTYKPFFEEVIAQLAEILAMRDDAKLQYAASGASPVIKHTNKAGHTNVAKNPALVIVVECNQQALAYWRELGLTPKGYKDVQEIVEVEKPVHEKKMLTIVGKSQWKKQA